ncbi:Pectin lyase-like superfamily protein [Zea mays]|nr:Pectin lyase-like superfamily protein [Zea mays]
MVRRKSQRASMRKRPGLVGPSTSPSWAPPAMARQTTRRMCRRHVHRRAAAWRDKDEKDVTDINVKDCTLKKTMFGVRIKAYEDAASVLTVSKIHYENIKMEDSANPIFIDMKYCQGPMHRRHHG